MVINYNLILPEFYINNASPEIKGKIHFYMLESRRFVTLGETYSGIIPL